MERYGIYLRRTLSIIMATFIAMAGFLMADVFIKQEERTEAVYHHGNVDPPVTYSIEYWIGNGKLAYRDGNLGILVDKEKGKAWVMNHGTKTFVETPLPVHLDNVADDEFAPRLKMFRTQGTVKPLDKEKKIGDLTCNLMEIVTWINYEGIRYNETVTEACMATDLSNDLKKAEEVLDELLGLRNFDEETYKTISALKGFPIETVSARYIDGTAIPITRKTLEMTVKEAPEGTYSVPDGYEKKDRLTRDEITGR